MNADNDNTTKGNTMNTTKGAYDFAKEIQKDAVQAAKRTGRTIQTEVRDRLRMIPVEFRTATYKLLTARGLLDQ